MKEEPLISNAFIKHNKYCAKIKGTEISVRTHALINVIIPISYLDAFAAFCGVGFFL